MKKELWQAPVSFIINRAFGFGDPGDDLVSNGNRRTLCTSTSILVMPEFKSILNALFFFQESIL